MRKCCQNYYTYYFSGYIEDCELHEADADNCTQGEQAFVHLSSEKSKIMFLGNTSTTGNFRLQTPLEITNGTVELGTGFDAYEKIVRLLNGDLKILGGQNYNIEVQEGTLTVATSTITSVTLNEGTLFAEENCTISNFKTLENNVTISGSNFTTITINDASLGSGFHTIGCNVELPNSLSSVDKIKLQNNGSLTLSEDLEINYLEVVDGALNGYNVTVLDSITSDSNTHFRINSGLNLNNINSSYELQFGKIELWEGLYLKNDLQIGDLILYGDNIHPSGDITLNITDLASDTDSNINMNCDLIINGTFSGNKTGSSLTLTSENTIIFGEGSSYNYTGELKLLNSTLEIQKDLTIPNLTLSGSSPTIMGDYGLTIGDLLSINGSGDAYLQTDVTISSSGQLDGNTATGSLIIGDAVNSATLTISSSNANTFGGTIQVNTNNGQIVVHSSQSISCGKFHLHKGNFGGTGTINVSEQLQLTGTVGAPVSIFGTISLTSGFKTPILTDTTTYTIVESTGKIIINTKMTAHYNGTLNLEGTLIIDSTSQINTLKPHVGSTVSGTAQLVVYGSLEFNDQAGSATFSTDLQVSNTLVDSTNIELILSNMTLDIDDTQVIFGKLTTQNGVRILATDITITDTLKHYGENNIDANVNINTGAVLNLQGSSTVTLGSDNSLVIEGSISAASGSLLVIKNNLTIQSTTTQTLNKLELSEPNTNLQCLNALSISSELLLTDNGNKTINCDLTLTGGALIKVSSGTPTLVLPYDKTLDLQNSVIMNLNLNVQNSGTINLSNELGINNLEIAHSSSEITGSYKLTINGLFDFSFATQKSLPELVLNGSAVATASSTLLLTSISFASSFTGAYGGLLKITNNLDSAVGITINELQLAGGSSVTGSGPIIVSSDLTLTNTTTIVIDNDLTISGSVSSTHNTLVQVNSGNLLKFSSGGNSARFVLIGNLENSGSLLEVTTIVLNSSPQILGTSKIKTNQLYFLNTGDKIISTHLEITSTIGDCTEGTLEISDTFNFNDNFTINDLTLSGNGNLTGNSKTITIDNSSNGKFTWSGSNTLLNSMHLSIYGTIESTLTEDTLTINDDSKLTINTASTTSSNVGGKINLSGTLEIDKNMTIGTLIFNSGSQVTGDQRVTVSTNLQLNSGEINFNTDVDSTNTITSSSTETNLIINSSFFRFADDFNIKQLILKSSTISSTSHTIDINTNFQWEGTSTINCQKLKTSSGTIENTAESDKLIINEGKTLEFTSLSSVTDNLQGTIDISGTLKTEIPFTIINLNLDTSGEITGTDKITITNMDFFNTGNKIISTHFEITSTIGDCTEGTLEISDTFNFHDDFTINDLTLSGNGNLIGNSKTITIDNSSNGKFTWSGSNTLLNSMYLSIYGTIESTSTEDTLTINDDSKLTINTASITSSNVGGGINLSGTLEIDKNMTIGTLIFNSGSQVTGNQKVTVSTNLQLNSGEINFNTDVDSTNTITSSSTETNLIINSSFFRFADDFNIKQLILKSSTISSTSHTIDINTNFQWEGTSTINCQKLKTSSGTIENTAESDKLIINEGKTLEFTSLSSVTDNLQGTIDISGTLKTEIPFTIINLNLDASGEITGTDKITITNMDFLNTGNKIISTHLEITSTIGDCTEGTLEISDTFNFNDNFTINDLTLSGNGNLTGNSKTITIDNSSNGKFTWSGSNTLLNSMYLSIYGTIESTSNEDTLTINDDSKLTINTASTTSSNVGGGINLSGTLEIDKNMTIGTLIFNSGSQVTGDQRVTVSTNLQLNSGEINFNTDVDSTNTITSSSTETNLIINSSIFRFADDFNIKQLILKSSTISSTSHTIDINTNFQWEGTSTINCQKLKTSSGTIENTAESDKLIINEEKTLEFTSLSSVTDNLQGTIDISGTLKTEIPFTIINLNLDTSGEITGTDKITITNMDFLNTGNKIISTQIEITSTIGDCTEGTLEISDTFNFNDNFTISNLTLSGNGNLIGNYKTITIDNLSNNGIFIWSGSNTLLNSMYLSIYGTIESTSNEDTLTINDDSKLTINTASITSSNVGGKINLSGTLEIDKNMTIGTLIFNSGSQVTGDQRVTVSTNLQLNSGEINFNTDVDSTNTITSSSTETNLIINSSIFRFADDFNIKQLILKSSTISSTSHTIDINNKFQWEGTSTINCQKLKTSSGTIENTAESDKLIINEGKTLEFTSLSSVTDNLQGTIDISGTLKTEIPFTIINLNLDTSGEITGTDKITITNMDFLNTGNKIISTHLEITSTIGDCTEGTLEISDTFNFHDDFTINDLNLTGNGYLTGNILTITNQFKFENSVNINCEKFTLNSPTKFINTDTNSELIIGNQNTFEIASGTTIQAAPLKGNLTILGTIITNQELKFETINLQDSCNLEGTADIIANSKLNFINSGIKTLNTNLISTTWTSDCPSNLTIEESTFTSPTSITIYSLSIKHNSILTGTQSLTILNNFEFSGNTEIDIQLLTIPSSSNVTNSDASSILTIKENSKLQYQTDSTINEHSGTFNVYGIFEANPSVTINAINLYDTSQILGTANNELIISNSFKLYNNGKKQIFKNINYQGLSANSHLTEGILEFSDCDFTFHDNLEIDKLYLNKEIKLTCPDGKLNIITELNLASNNTETLIIDTDLELNENSITAISNRKIEIINIKKLINNGTIKFLSENNEIIGDNNIFENNNKILFKNSNFISDLNFINKGNLTIINSNCTFTNEFNQSQSTNPDLRFYSNENTIVEFNGLTSNFQYGDFEINGKLILQSSTAFNLEYGVTNNIQFNLINSETEIYDNSKIINAYNKIQIGEVLIEMGEIIDSTIEILSKTTLDQSNQKIINSTLILNQLTEIYGSEINLSQDSIIYFQDSDIFVHNDCSFISLDAGNEDCQININSVNNDQNLELLENSNLEINNLKLNFNDLSIITNDNSDFKIVNSRSTVVAQEIEFKGNLTIDNSIIEFLPISNNCNLTNIELIHENSNFTCLEQLNLNGVFEWNEGTLEFSTFNVLADNGYFTINLSGDDKEILNKEILNHHNLTINDNLNENNAAIFRNSKIQNYAYLTLHSKIESDSDQSYIKNNLNSTIDITKNSTILNITMLNLGTLKVEIGNEFPQKLIQEKGEIMLKTSFFNNLKFIDGTITSIGTNYQKIILQKLSWTMGLFEKIQIEIKGQTYLISKNTKKLENSQLFVYGVGSSLIWKEGNIEAGSTSITNEGKFIIENPDEKLYFRKTDTQTSTFKNYGTVKLFSNTDAHLDLVFYNYNEFKMINSQISFDSFYSNYDADVTSSISLNNGTINTEYVFQHNTGELLIEEDSTITSQNIIQLSSNITLERCKLDLSAEKKIKSWSNTFFEMTIEQDPNNFVGFSLQSDEIELLHTLIVNYERTLNSNREINDTYKLIDFVNNDQLTRSDIFTNDANGNSLDYICEDNQYFDLVYNSGDDDDASESGALTDISSRFVGCYVGTYNAGSRIQKCLSCDQGTYTNTYGSSVCSDCQPGSFSDIMGASVCFECDYGHHQNESRATFCDPCDEGYYQDEMGGEYCKECMDGYYAENKTSITCQICKEGSYTEDRTRCIECQAGTYNPTAGKTECLACKAGTAKQSTGAIACDSCFYDEYQDETGQETCKSCPSNTITLSIKSTILEDCICTVNRYGPNGGPCLKCPEGAECFDVGIEIPDAQYGYWHSLENPYEYIECAIDEACPGGEVGKCNNELGYDGSLCSVCMQGFYKMDERCVTCPSSAIWRLVVAVFALLIFTSFLFVVAKKARAYFASFAIAFSFFQVLSVMGSLKLNWPSKITNAFHFLSIFNFNLDILATECSFTVTFYQKWVFIMLSPFTFLVLMIIIYFVAIGHSKLVCKFGAKFIDKFPNFCSQPNYKNRLFAPLYWLRYQFSRVFTHGFSEEDRKELFNNLINSYSCLLTFIYLYVSMKVLQMFQCTKGESSEGDVQYFLTENSEVLCYDSSWYKLLPWVIFFGIIYIIGIPALLLYMLNYYAKNVEDKLFDARLGLLCARYSKEWYYWELVIMTRKLIFIIFECFLNYNPFLQTGLCSLLLLISLLLQLYTQPFLAKRHNTLEFTLLIISQVILLSGMIFVSEDFSEENSRAKLAIAIIFIIWVGVCILGSMIIFEIRHRYRVNIGKDEDELEKAIDLWKGKPIIEFIKNKPSFRHFLTWISLLNKNKLNTTLELYRILNPYLSQIKVKRKSSNDHDQNNYGKGNRDISENKLDDLVIIFNKTYHNHLLSFFHLWYKKNASHLQKIAITKILLSFNNYYYKNNLFMARNSKIRKK